MEARAAAGSASRPGSSVPLVSVVIPTMNEARFVEGVLDSLRAQTYPAERLEILAVDGGSTDDTIRLLGEAADADPRLRVMGGPGVNCPAALNVGIRAARGSIVWYIGGHGRADPDFVARAVARLDADPGLGCVGGTIDPVAEDPVALANRIARFSRFGVGGGVLTTAPVLHEVETVQWGAYRKDALQAAGLFDPALQFGEDEELNFRLRRAGFRILYDPELRIRYVGRATFGGLFRQYRNYGRARVRVLRKHPSFFRPKHVVPAATVAGLAAAAVATAIRRLRAPGLLALGAYASYLATAGVVLAARHRFPYPHYVAVSLACLHVGYGLGFLRGVVDAARGR